MPKNKKSNSTSKYGVNYVRGIVEHDGCIFHKIEQENDFGIDSLIEFFRDEMPLHKQVAAQIKSGKSYYNEKSDECLIPIEDHRDYWQNHSLPVIGIVYVPLRKTAYWIDIKAFLKNHPEARVIRFKATKINTLDETTFTPLFVSLVLNKTPTIPYDEAVSFLQSDHANEVHLGVFVLFRRYPNVTETWDHLLALFKEAEANLIPPVLIYFFAHVPWHGDIASFGERLTEQTRNYVRETHFSKFGVAEVIKLLGYVDDDAGFSRGSLGQSVEAIISLLPEGTKLLKEVFEQNSQPIEIRERAVLIYAMHEPEKALPLMAELNSQGSDWMGELIEHIKEFEEFNPYC